MCVDLPYVSEASGPKLVRVMHCWDYALLEQMPTVARGDWFITPAGKPHCCRMYLEPGNGLVGGNVAPGTYLGPVHDHRVTNHGEFLAVLVPSVWTPPRNGVAHGMDPPSLVWITVHCAHNLRMDWTRPVSYALKIAAVEQWRLAGWENIYLD